jgi:hypothetical protein
MTREQRIEAVLERFGKYVVQQARANLTRKNKNVSKDLYNSIKWESDASQTGASFSASLSMLPYGDFQDKGVRGTDASPINTSNSPFRFGKSKGSGKKQGGLSDSINKWVKARRIQFRDKKGKFMSYDSTAFLISRSIYRKGIPASFFYSRPFGLAFQKLPAELVEAFRLTPDDFKEFLRK